MSDQPVSGKTDAGPVAYLTGEYPKVSHTFIQREVAALRSLGLTVETCSVRRAPPASVGADQQDEAARTFCIIETARRAPHRLIGAHLRLLAVAPRRWLGALRLARATCPPGAKAALWQAFYVLEAGLLADHLRRRGVRHLHNHFANSSCSVAMLTAQMSGIPFSFTEHGPATFFEPRLWRLDEKIARARFVAAISHFCRSQLMLFSDPAEWNKISIVHCGIDPDRYDTGPRDPASKQVLFIGRLEPVKGGPLLLEAFARIAERHPDARLTIIGDGPDRPALQDRAKALGMDQAVSFAGFRTQDQVAAQLASADMLVLPSFAEGVPVVLMEAMAARLPTIASRVAGVPELVLDGETGFVIPPGDLEALADRLDRLLSDPALRHTMGAAGRDRVRAEFDQTREAAKLEAMFRRSLAQEPG